MQRCGSRPQQRPTVWAGWPLSTSKATLPGLVADGEVEEEKLMSKLSANQSRTYITALALLALLLWIHPSLPCLLEQWSLFPVQGPSSCWPCSIIHQRESAEPQQAKTPPPPHKKQTTGGEKRASPNVSGASARHGEAGMWQT